MSGMPSADDLGVKAEEVTEDRNIIEKIIGSATSSDDYLQAILKVQNAQLKILREEFKDSVRSVNGIPHDSAGIAASTAAPNNKTPVVFSIDGRDKVKDMEAVNRVVRGQVVMVDYFQGGVVPVDTIDSSYLGIGAFELNQRQPSGYKYYQSEQDYDVGPGETQTILSADVEEPQAISKVGTSSKDYTEYQYIIDGESFTGQTLSSPLGLFNNMFEFSYPLIFGNSFEVKVYRLENAPGFASYYSNAVALKSP